MASVDVKHQRQLADVLMVSVDVKQHESKGRWQLVCAPLPSAGGCVVLWTWRCTVVSPVRLGQEVCQTKRQVVLTACIKLDAGEDCTNREPGERFCNSRTCLRSIVS